jgi:hypothetical protein
MNTEKTSNQGHPLPSWEQGRATKGMAVLGLLRRENGASVPEIMDETGWQAHTVRGFFAGQQLKRTGYKAVRFVRDDGQAAYRAYPIGRETGIV